MTLTLTARAYLQFDHVEPHARGGASAAATGRLLRDTHDRLEAERVFGRAFIERQIAAAQAAAPHAAEI